MKIKTRQNLRRLGPRHVELLTHLIQHGEIRETVTARDFERSLDQVPLDGPQWLLDVKT